MESGSFYSGPPPGSPPAANHFTNNSVLASPSTGIPSAVPVPVAVTPNFHRHQQPSTSSLNGSRDKRSSSHISWAGRPASVSRAPDEDSKTSVRVVVRVRPPLHQGDPSYDAIPQRFQTPVVQVSSQTGLSVESGPSQSLAFASHHAPSGNRKLFVFDRVFDPHISQDGVWDYLSESVNHFVDGYNVSLLAYGQSGSGKSYTMGTTGKSEQENPERMGIVPRAARALFDRLHSVGTTSTAGTPHPPRTSSMMRTPIRYSVSGSQSFASPSRSLHGDRNWQLHATYVEIYNEQLRDLLLPDSLVGPAGRPTISIREDPRGRIILTGLRQIAINSIEDLLDVLNSGSSIRQTDSTAVNAKSSRSHAIFSLNLIQKKNSPNQPSSPPQDKRMSTTSDSFSFIDASSTTIDSKLHFVDLAGSERLKNTGAQGERAREGISINAGLATLGKVISQLSRNQSAHVSYRDSRLTRILQDSLGGNAITYMIACVNPIEFHISETLNTLQYAQRARAIQSKPQIQQISDERDKQAIIDRLRAEVTMLRGQIRNADNGAGGRRQARRIGSNNALANSGQFPDRERENELRGQILAFQENYSALSQRHAKLISELTKAREAGDAAEMMSSATSALSSIHANRLKSQGASSEAIEKVVLEYEKTIQSLESSLSTTRASLSSLESTMLERENRIAYLETTAEKLQARIKKSLDREANDERYLRELEARIEGASTHEEKGKSVVEALTRELARARETEASCEDYIITLEERLADADQDCDMMQREIARLENTLERERNIGKLDSLLHELDRGAAGPPEQFGTMLNDSDSETLSNAPFPTLTDANDMPFYEEEEQTVPSFEGVEESGVSKERTDSVTPSSKQDGEVKTVGSGRSSRRSDEIGNVHDDLENLYDDDDDDYVVIHGMTLREQKQFYRQNLSRVMARYEEAVSRISELESGQPLAKRSTLVVDERGSPSSKTPDSLNGLEMSLDQVSSRRSLGSFHDHESDGSTTAGNSMISYKGRNSNRLSFNQLSVHTQNDTTVKKNGSEDRAVGHLGLPPISTKGTMSSISTPSLTPRRPALPVVDELASPLEEDIDPSEEPEKVIRNLRDRYEKLVSQYESTVSQVEGLKLELHRAQATSTVPGTPSTPLQLASSPGGYGSSPQPHIIRRMSSQMLSSSDRPQQIIQQLQTRLDQDFKLDRNVMSLVEGELHRVMIDLQMRTDRIGGLEAELAGLKQQISQKSNIITGLTRERMSLQATTSSPIDKSLISILQDEIVAKEKQMQAQSAVVSELQREVQNLKSRLSISSYDEKRGSQVSADPADYSIEGDHGVSLKGADGPAPSALGLRESTSSTTILDNLRAEHSRTLNELETSHAEELMQLEERHSLSESCIMQELEAQKRLVENLDKKLSDRAQQSSAHEQSMRSLEDSYQSKMKELVVQLEAVRASEAVLREKVEQSEGSLESARKQLDESRERVTKLLLGLATHLHRERREGAEGADVDQEVESLLAELSSSKASLEASFEELQKTHEQTIVELEEVRLQEKKSTKVAEELEEQMTTQFNRELQQQRKMSESTEKGALEKAQARIAELEAQVSTQVVGFDHSDYEGELGRGDGGDDAAAAAELSRQAQVIEDQEGRLRTVEKHLTAEKQLTATLEEALTDLEGSSTKLRSEMDSWRRKCLALEEELGAMRQERNESRQSVQQLEKEKRSARAQVEREQASLAARMQQLESSKGGSGGGGGGVGGARKKLGSLNCF